MEVIQRLSDFASNHEQIVLTIGNFDGVHRGHHLILNECQSLASDNGHSVVLTFSNHPSEILKPGTLTPLLCTLPHKLKLIESCHIQTVILIPFTLSLAQQSPTHFIEMVRRFVPFTTLLLGYNAVMGKNRQGDKAMLTDLSLEWGFHVTYLDEYRYEGKPVSSTTIRQLLQEGQIAQVADRLGRPYSIYTTATLISKQDSKLFEAHVDGLCLPPNGSYQVKVKFHQESSILQTGIVKINQNRLFLKIDPQTEKFNNGQLIEIIFDL